jgi:hypothetical protein
VGQLQQEQQEQGLQCCVLHCLLLGLDHRMGQYGLGCLGLSNALDTGAVTPPLEPLLQGRGGAGGVLLVSDAANNLGKVGGAAAAEQQQQGRKCWALHGLLLVLL